MLTASLIVLIALLGIGFVKLCRAYGRVCYERNWAINYGFTARQECNLLVLKIAIIRFTRDVGRVPRSMAELRGHKSSLVDFINPFTGRPSTVNDLTGSRLFEPYPHDITFRYIPADDVNKLDERCVISMHDESAQPRKTCVYFAPELVTS